MSYSNISTGGVVWLCNGAPVCSAIIFQDYITDNCELCAFPASFGKEEITELSDYLFSSLYSA